MVTPFDEHGALDLDAAVRLARWLADHGSDGLVVAGTTGEGPVLTDDEKCDAVAGGRRGGHRAGDRRHGDQRHPPLDRADRAGAATAGVDAVLVVTPYYNRPSQAGLARPLLRRWPAPPTLPVMLYDIPVRTGRQVATTTMLRLAARRAQRGGGEGRRRATRSGLPDWCAARRTRFEVYCGDDALTLAARWRSVPWGW